MLLEDRAQEKSLVKLLSLDFDINNEHWERAKDFSNELKELKTKIKKKNNKRDLLKKILER